MSHQSRTTVIFISSAIAFVVAILWLSYFIFMIGPVNPDLSGPEHTNHITIPSGKSLDQIASTLEKNGLIRSKKFFKLYSLFSGNAHMLKPGKYEFDPSFSTAQITQKLVRGPGQEVTVLIWEGFTVIQIEEMLLEAAVLTEAGSLRDYPVKNLLEKYPFLDGAPSLEGFLFPDTYRFFYASTPEQVITILLDNFVEKVSPLVADLSEYERRNIVIQRQEFTIAEVLTIASLIEKEVPDANERRLVSGIMHKRLQIGMPLQIDATVDYAKVHGLRFDTYEFYGLPPGAIANPGLDAIEAALNPRASSYLFYLSDPKTGQTIFANDFEEHKENQAEYLW